MNEQPKTYYESLENDPDTKENLKHFITSAEGGEVMGKIFANPHFRKLLKEGIDRTLITGQIDHAWLDQEMNRLLHSDKIKIDL